jgi:hypothetical protein
MTKTSPPEYRQWAIECRVMAATAKDPKERKSWTQLANEMEQRATEQEERVSAPAEHGALPSVGRIDKDPDSSQERG